MSFADEQGCARLIAQYARFVDSGEAARVAELFTEDGVWESPEVRMNGRAEIAKGFMRRQEQTDRVSRHVCTNVLIDVVTPDEAESTCVFTLYRADGIEPGSIARTTTPAMVGDYVDRFVRTPEGWRFSHRRAEVAFLAK